MIPRADFALQDDPAVTFEQQTSLSVRDLKQDGLIRPLLRKPDFQRETNHWSPEQVASLLECFVNGDLIPSVIVWRSPSYLFVIDGGHRLSAIAAWIEDDYGDGPRSRAFFGQSISREQIRAADQARNLVAKQIKTLDLPLGGSTGVRTALQVLVEFMLNAVRNQQGEPKSLKDTADDTDGTATRTALTRVLTLASRITGNENGSLGLHPAIYFYGPTGRHLNPMFLGLTTLFGRKIINNDKLFFEKFTKVRGQLEDILVLHKELIATILQKTISRHRIPKYAEFIDSLVSQLYNQPDKKIAEADLINYTGLTGKIIVGADTYDGEKFSDETKSSTFIKTALKCAIRCPVCNGYLDPSKSVSYDHIQEKATGGKSTEDNCQLLHPYCNQAVKNKVFQDGLKNTDSTSVAIG